ncbi:hypothetical protein U0070_014375 [Myodes glareolus]|uniref:U1-type domain-containing protein n=1 Tax=Myodes glareolus TaxID=447135 RepID=A0AAW0J7T1_MYOGA
MRITDLGVQRQGQEKHLEDSLQHSSSHDSHREDGIVNMAAFLRGFEEKGLKNDRPGDQSSKEKKKILFSFCDVCNIQLNSAAQAQVHYDGKSHRKRVKQLSDGQPPPPAPGSGPLLASACPCPGTNTSTESHECFASNIEKNILKFVGKSPNPGIVETVLTRNENCVLGSGTLFFQTLRAREQVNRNEVMNVWTLVL